MKLSNKPRHWLALAVAIPTMILSVMTALDFSGEPTPQWRKTVNGLGTSLMLVLIIMNLHLDRKDREGGGE